MPQTVVVAQDLPARARASTAAVADAETALRLRLKQRRELIFEAVDDHGMTQQEVAKLFGIAKSRVSAILASPDDDQ